MSKLSGKLKWTSLGVGKKKRINSGPCPWQGAEGAYENKLQLGNNMLHVAISKDITTTHGADSLTNEIVGNTL